MTLKDLSNATSSLESADGATHLDSRDGLTIDLFGQEAPLVSHSVPLALKKVRKTKDTCSPCGLASSASVALQQSLESKLRAQLPMGGLMMFIKGWKQKATPSGRLYCQLAALVRPISEIDCGLWATPNTMDGIGNRSQEAMARQFNTTRKGRTAPANLREQVNPAMWPTVLSWDSKKLKGSQPAPNRTGGGSLVMHVAGMARCGLIAQTGSGDQLNPRFPCWLMGYPIAWESCAGMVTPLSRKSRRSSSSQAKEVRLPHMHADGSEVMGPKRELEITYKEGL